ncbi:MAG: class II SORL domain-containing protein [Methanosarcinales archaeon]|nr:class II SORL domain-containing protein [Methanosarcinales archaeon]
MVDKCMFCGINVPADESNLTDAEKKHIPVITAPDTVKAGEPFDVTIEVGSIPHVMEIAHHIQWIDLYSGENFISKVILTPEFTKAKVTLTLVKSGAHPTTPLSAIERCNVHGLWKATKEIKVES